MSRSGVASAAALTSSRDERGRDPLQDPEHVIGVQARVLAGDLELRRRQ